MPDPDGRIPPVFFNAEAWSRIFSVEEECEVCGHVEGHCEGEEPDCPENAEEQPPDLEITWTPDLSLDGAHFTPEWS